MEQIWAPWRMEYIKSQKPEGCIFCEKSKENRDRENHILYMGNRNFIIMNIYPYNPGHLMVATYRHVGNLEDLSGEELCEHFEMVRKGVEVLKKAFNPDGFNMGMNIRKAAGAGVEDHIHTHIVPRWEGDTSFMSVVADTRVVPEALESTYKKLEGLFA